MLAFGLFSLLLSTAAVPSAPPTPAFATDIVDTAVVSVLWRDTTTVRPRPKVVQISDWYYRRLTIHRIVAYATVPVFGLQWAAGDQLYRKGSDAPTWAKSMHRAGATALAGMFTVNTVTGLWNLWDSRSVPDHRALRTVHALTMLAADAAFTYAGAKLSNEAETSASKRQLHRTIALSAMGVTVLSGVAMKILNK